jgi:hypothetical protein
MVLLGNELGALIILVKYCEKFTLLVHRLLPERDACRTVFSLSWAIPAAAGVALRTRGQAVSREQIEKPLFLARGAWATGDVKDVSCGALLPQRLLGMSP